MLREWRSCILCCEGTSDGGQRETDDTGTEGPRQSASEIQVRRQKPAAEKSSVPPILPWGPQRGNVPVLLLYNHPRCCNVKLFGYLWFVFFSRFSVIFLFLANYVIVILHILSSLAKLSNSRETKLVLVLVTAMHRIALLRNHLNSWWLMLVDNRNITSLWGHYFVWS